MEKQIDLNLEVSGKLTSDSNMVTKNGVRGALRYYRVLNLFYIL